MVQRLGRGQQAWPTDAPMAEPGLHLTNKRQDGHDLEASLGLENEAFGACACEDGADVRKGAQGSKFFVSGLARFPDAEELGLDGAPVNQGVSLATAFGAGL